MRHLRVELSQLKLKEAEASSTKVEGDANMEKENNEPVVDNTEKKKAEKTEDFQKQFIKYVQKVTEYLNERRANKSRARSKSFDFGNSLLEARVRERKLSCQIDYMIMEMEEDYDLSLGLSPSEERILERIYAEYLNLLKWTGTAADKLHEEASSLDNYTSHL